MLPREKLFQLGVEALTLSELLSILLGSGTREQSVFSLSDQVVSKPDFRKSFLDKRVEFWTKIPGIGPTKAARLVAGVELSKRLFFPEIERAFIQSSNDVFLYFQNKVVGKTNESFYVLCLNSKNEIIFFKEMHVGFLDFVLTDMKDVFSTILQTGAKSFICVHNHPSQNVQPSIEDRELTKKIYQASKFLDLQFLDHIIVSVTSHYSFFEREPNLFIS